jgi:hypothetical protein
MVLLLLLHASLTAEIARGRGVARARRAQKMKKNSGALNQDVLKLTEF